MADRNDVNRVNTFGTNPQESSLEARPRRRRWWLIWSCGWLFLLMAVVAAPILYAQWRLRGVPDVGPPFDVKAESTFTVPRLQNAFTHYADAYTVFAPIEPLMAGHDSAVVMENMKRTVEKGWDGVDPVVAQWVELNQPALAKWRDGTQQSVGIEVQPGEISVNSQLPSVVYLRDFARLAMLQSEKVGHEGDVAAQWDWIKAALRASRHMEMHSSRISRMNGGMYLAVTVAGFKRWAADSRVTADQLKQALADMQEIDRMSPPLSDTIKVEYFCAINTVTKEDQDKSAERLFGNDRKSKLIYHFGGEREMMRRAAQLVYANWLAHCDKPLSDQPPLLTSSVPLYSTGPSAPAGVPMPTPPQIQSIVDDLFFINQFHANSLTGMLIEDARDQARRGNLTVTLAAQLYFREHGEFPESAEQLVGQGLTSLPRDPFGAGESIRLKRESDGTAAAWSVGVNRTDDGGAFERDAGGTDPLDLGSRIARPAKGP